MPQNTLKAFELVPVDVSALTAAYSAMTYAYGHPIVRLHIYNNSDVDVSLSYDGSTTHDIIVSKTEFTIVPPLSSIPNNKVAVFGQYTILYGAAKSGTGNLYIAAYYV